VFRQIRATTVLIHFVHRCHTVGVARVIPIEPPTAGGHGEVPAGHPQSVLLTVVNLDRFNAAFGIA
jgi:hypothetical protein